MDTVPDEKLVERVRAGEKGLYEVLMRRYNERLYRVTRAIVRNSHEAADVVQEAFFRAYTHLDQFSGTAKFSTWLTKIAVHESVARLRQRARMTDSEIRADTGNPSRIEALESSISGPEQQAVAKQALEILEAAVDALPYGLRSVFMMREIEEMSTAETAECLGISEEAVKTRLHRARAMIRRAVTVRIGAVATGAFQFNAPRCDRVVPAVLARISQC